MQNNYDFYHLHHYLVDVIQMWGGFKIDLNGGFQCPQCVLVLEAQLPPCSSFDMVSRLSNSKKRVFECSQKC